MDTFCSYRFVRKRRGERRPGADESEEEVQDNSIFTYTFRRYTGVYIGKFPEQGLWSFQVVCS